jgi:hypothetical protein
MVRALPIGGSVSALKSVMENFHRRKTADGSDGKLMETLFQSKSS